MHIAIDGTPAVNDIRAIQRYTGNLIKELAEIDHENRYSIIYLGCKTDTVSSIPKINNPNYLIIFSSIPGKLLKASWALSSFPKISFWTKKKADLIHFPGGCAYIPTSGEKVITTLHGFHQQLIPQYMNPKERPLVLKYLNQTIKNSDYFITVSEANKNELMQLWGVSGERITAIPLGISPEFGQFNVSKEERVSFLKKYSLPEKSFILYVGALEPHKNIHGVINAYSLLDQKFHRNFNLVFIGAETSHCSKYREMISKLNISEYVFFVNYIQPGSSDLAYFYNLADLFIFPTFYEGWASPPLESMKCGTPVVVSDIPSLKESTGGIATYCKPDDPKDIAEKIMGVISDRPKHEKLVGSGLQFTSKCTWRRCTEKTLELYDSKFKS
ncbi:MAG: glycosyltransferase family 1 protein [Victivallales bacterium]